MAELFDFLKAAQEDSTLVSALGAVAREYVEEQTGRALITQTWKITSDSWPTEKLILEKCPLVSVTSVKYYPEDGSAQATLSNSLYRVMIAGDNSYGWIELLDGETWPDLAVRSDAVQVIFVAGSALGSVKKQIVQSICLLAKHMYDDGRNPVAIGQIIAEIPFTLRDLIASQRVAGWTA